MITHMELSRNLCNYVAIDQMFFLVDQALPVARALNSFS